MDMKGHSQDRQEIIRRLGQEEVRLHGKMHSLDTERQRVHFELADLHRAQGRAAAPLPATDICPACWINRGEKVQLANGASVCPQCGG